MIHDIKTLKELLPPYRFTPEEIARVAAPDIDGNPHDPSLIVARDAYETLRKMSAGLIPGGEVDHLSVDFHLKSLGEVLRQAPVRSFSETVDFKIFLELNMEMRRLTVRTSSARIPLDPITQHKTFRYWWSPDLRQRFLSLTALVRRAPHVSFEFREEVRDSVNLLMAAGYSLMSIDIVFPGIVDIYSKLSRPKQYDEQDVHFGYPWQAGELATVTVEPDFDAAIDIRPGHLVLDPMVGIGRNMLPLAERHSRARFMGFDLNPYNLRQAIEGASDAQLSFQRVSFSSHDARRRYPLRDDSVDRVVINNDSTYQFTPKQNRRFFADMGRILKVGGRLWIDFEPYPEPRDETVNALVDVWREDGIGFKRVPLGGKWKNSSRAFVFEITRKNDLVGGGEAPRPRSLKPRVQVSLLQVLAKGSKL